jgi:hypothetical protein
VALRQVLEGNENSVAGNIFKRSKDRQRRWIHSPPFVFLICRRLFVGNAWAAQKTRILIKPGSILEVHDPFSFSAPPFTGPRLIFPCDHSFISYFFIFS